MPQTLVWWNPLENLLKGQFSEEPISFYKKRNICNHNKALMHLNCILKFLRYTLRHLQKVIRLSPKASTIVAIWGASNDFMITVIVFLTTLQNMETSDSGDGAHPEHISTLAYNMARNSIPLILSCLIFSCLWISVELCTKRKWTWTVCRLSVSLFPSFAGGKLAQLSRV